MTSTTIPRTAGSSVVASPAAWNEFFEASGRQVAVMPEVGNWGVIYDALKQAGIQIPTGPNSQFQFVTIPMVAAWNNAEALYYADDYANYPSADMGPVFARGVTSISDAYFDFINSLEYPDSSQDPQYQRLLALQKNLRTQIDAVNQDSVGAFKAWKANGGTDLFPAIQNYTDWLASGPAGGQQYQGRISDLQLQLNNVNQQLIPFQTGSALAISQAIANMSPANMVSTAIPGGGGQVKKVYSQSIMPELGPLLQQWQSGQKSHSVEMVITANSQQAGDWFVEGAGEVGFSSGIFGFTAKGEASYSNQVESDSHFQCKLSVQANSTFSLVRNSWFDGALVAQYPNGPWAGKTADQFFGPEGTLKLVPSQILVSYGTNMTLTVSESTMTQVKQQWKASGGLMIGPFFLGANALSSSTTSSNSDGSLTITTTSTDNNAYITGILSQSFYNGD